MGESEITSEEVFFYAAAVLLSILLWSALTFLILRRRDRPETL